MGIAPSLTDFCYCCYLSDLVVRDDYKEQGIGRELVRLTKYHAGEGCKSNSALFPGSRWFLYQNRHGANYHGLHHSSI
ncbi:hypothetical protein [Spirosoma pollinicola]|uniref:hypothetical protein n=1 Tax=Spirosoma pollinicola TaxID=2057025 RepID=UPI003744598D